MHKRLRHEVILGRGATADAVPRELVNNLNQLGPASELARRSLQSVVRDAAYAAAFTGAASVAGAVGLLILVTFLERVA